MFYFRYIILNTTNTNKSKTLHKFVVNTFNKRPEVSTASWKPVMMERQSFQYV